MKKVIVILLLILMIFLVGCQGYQLVGLVVLKPNYLEIITEFNGTFNFDARSYDWKYVDTEPSLIRVTETSTGQITTFVVRNILYFTNY